MKTTFEEQRAINTLMNFRIPEHLKSDFYLICRSQHISMTARLNFMILEFVKGQNPSKTQDYGFPPNPLGEAWRDHLHAE
ncbi:hypothetical protein RC74_09585 [Falsihalocynthiibacter arcticus]|uniref:Uncharacterized protein n=1 Tax=Falsihalocynthiibacter arcticus TaxID=1579316 RepID=A0A126V0J6_9RHOB|nr:hypothetical protein RC74_09585 [Falsihalocynthiibacter arcticus]